MSTQVQFRRGTTANMNLFAGVVGEVTVDTTKKVVVVHDGSTLGGNPMAPANNPSFTGTVTLQNALGVAYGGTGITSFGTGVATALGNNTNGASGICVQDASGYLNLTSPTSRLVIQPSTTTSSALSAFINTGGTAYLGLDSSAGGLTAAYALNIYHGGAYPIVFSTSGTRAMTLDASGNLGIGTPSPSYKFHVSGGNAAVVNSSGATIYIGQGLSGADYAELGVPSDKSAFNIKSDSTLPMVFWTNANQRLWLDASGNLGLGVTPSAWSSGRTAFQVRKGILSTINGFDSYINLGANWYSDSVGTDRYISSDYASYYYQYQGKHVWSTAPSGSAGAAISFTQAMTLDASGRLGIGTASPTHLLTLYKSSLPEMRLTDGTVTYQCYSSGSEIVQGTVGAHAMTFRTSATERARIDASGNLLVGTTTTGGGKVCVKATPTSQYGIDFSESTITLASGASTALAVGSGIFCITDTTSTGATALYLIGNGAVLVNQSSGSLFVSSTSSPAAGKVSIANVSGTMYLYNNYGSTITFGIAMLRTRNSN